MSDHFTGKSEPTMWPGMLVAAAVVALCLTVLLFLLQ